MTSGVVNSNCEGVLILDDLDLVAIIAMLGLIIRNGHSQNVPAQAYDIAKAMMQESEKRDDK